MKRVSVNADWKQVFVIRKNVRIMINVDRCKCKELINKGLCDKGYACNPNNCECECYKSCDFGEYLDYGNCKCRKRLVDKLVEECNENIDEAKLTKIALFEHKNECVRYYTVFIVWLQFALGSALILFIINT